MGHEGLSEDRGAFAARTAAGQLHTPITASTKTSMAVSFRRVT